ncbi:MAG: hypothetical protein KJ072_01550 [Verrucomicrobia bacterium]|nr:hypothetical protein [Verrucomicrobiota bacterium]
MSLSPCWFCETLVATSVDALIAVPRGEVQGSGGESIKVATEVATKALIWMRLRLTISPCRRLAAWVAPGYSDDG